MRSIAELNSRQLARLSTDPNTTKIATTGITDLQPTKWATEVLKFGESLRLLDQIVYITKAMVGTKDE